MCQQNVEIFNAQKQVVQLHQYVNSLHRNDYYSVPTVFAFKSPHCSHFFCISYDFWVVLEGRQRLVQHPTLWFRNNELEYDSRLLEWNLVAGVA